MLRGVCSYNMGRNMGGTADHFVPCILRNTRDFSCRALNENEPKAKFEFSANGTCALSEVESKTKVEVSAAGTCRAEQKMKGKER